MQRLFIKNKFKSFDRVNDFQFHIKEKFCSEKSPIIVLVAPSEVYNLIQYNEESRFISSIHELDINFVSECGSRRKIFKFNRGLHCRYWRKSRRGVEAAES